MGSGDEDILNVFTIYGNYSHIDHVTGMIWKKNAPSTPEDSI